MNLKKILVALSVVGILAAAIIITSILIETKPKNVKTPNRTVVLGVKTIPAEVSDQSVTMNYNGKVLPREMVALSSLVSGQILKGNVELKAGQSFRKGDLILNIFDEDIKASYYAQKSNFLNTLAKSLPDLKLDFPEQYDKWYNFLSAIDIKKKLPALPSINSTKEKVYISSKNILSSYYSLVEREIVLDRYKTYAPFNGVLTAVTKEVGSIASVGGEVAKMVSTEQLELVVGVLPEDGQKLKAGTVVDVVSDGGKTYKGTINRIASFVEPTTQRVNVYVSFYEPTMEIIGGQMLSIELPSVSLTDVSKVAREAVYGDSLIYVVSNNLLHSRPIEVVASNSKHSFIKGVVVGDTVVNESLVAPYEDMKVKKLDMSGELIDSVL